MSHDISVATKRLTNVDVPARIKGCMLKPGFRVFDEQRRPLVDSIGRYRRTLSVSESRTGLGRRMFHVPVRQSHHRTWYSIGIICCVDEMQFNTRVPLDNGMGKTNLREHIAQRVHS